MMANVSFARGLAAVEVGSRGSVKPHKVFLVDDDCCLVRYSLSRCSTPLQFQKCRIRLL